MEVVILKGNDKKVSIDEYNRIVIKSDENQCDPRKGDFPVYIGFGNPLVSGMEVEPGNDGCLKFSLRPRKRDGITASFLQLSSPNQGTFCIIREEMLGFKEYYTRDRKWKRLDNKKQLPEDAWTVLLFPDQES